MEAEASRACLCKRWSARLLSTAAAAVQFCQACPRSHERLGCFAGRRPLEYQVMVSTSGSGRNHLGDELEDRVRQQEALDLTMAVQRPAACTHPPAEWGAMQPTQRKRMQRRHEQRPLHRQDAEGEVLHELVRVGSFQTCPGRDPDRGREDCVIDFVALPLHTKEERRLQARPLNLQSRRPYSRAQRR